MRFFFLTVLLAFTTSVFASHPCSKPKYNEKCYRKAHDLSMKKVNVLYNQIMSLESASPRYKQRLEVRVKQWIRTTGYHCRSTACSLEESVKMIEYLTEQRKMFNEVTPVLASTKYTLLMDY